jgi:hypothetical protein
MLPFREEIVMRARDLPGLDERLLRLLGGGKRPGS